MEPKQEPHSEEELPPLIMADELDKDGLLITSSNAHKLKQEYFDSLEEKKFWHKFSIENGGLFDKEEVLYSVVNAMRPGYLVPVKYTVEGKNSFFLARECERAIQCFCSKSCPPIEVNKNQDVKIILTIQICYMPFEDLEIDMIRLAKDALLKRIVVSPELCMDLTEFHKEPGLYDIMYCPICIPKSCANIFTLLRLPKKVKALKLCKNNLEGRIPEKYLQNFAHILKLDLSQNKIKDIKFLEEMGKVMKNLEELSLKDNPIFNSFRTDMDYAKAMKKIFPKLLMLDDTRLCNGIPNRQVWSCTEGAAVVANAFLKHFFILYDKHRQALELTYDENAIFSMTCSEPIENSEADELEKYHNYSRKMTKVDGQNKIVGVSHMKNTNIARVLCDLPPTKHDPFSFKVDIMLFQKTCMSLTVSGVFKDFQTNTKVRSFNRTFMLKKVARDEYKITNDMFHVNNATEEQISNSFLFPLVDYDYKGPLVNKDEEENLIKLMESLTRMNTDYVRKCLQDCDWNVIKAFEVFLENYCTFNIPPEAFTK